MPHSPIYTYIHIPTIHRGQRGGAVTGGAGDRTADLPIGGRPAPPPEPRR